MGRPRVLLVTPDFPPDVGGIQELMGRLAQTVTGIEVRVLALGQPDAVAFDERLDIEVRRCASVAMDRRFAAFRLNARSVAEVAAFRPDVILSGHVVASIGAIVLRKLLRTPFIQYVHADEFRVRPSLAGRAVRSADATIAVSRYTREMAIGSGADPSRVRVIPPGIDLPARFDARRDGPPTIATVATLRFRRKGHDVVVRALPLVRARVPAVRWIIIGDGVFRPAIESAIAAYGLEGVVELRGRVGDDERNRVLESASVFCMPSRMPARGVGGEGFGIVYLEAAARGLPSVGGDVAGARDAIADGQTGLLVDPTNHIAVANALTDLLRDRNRARQMGEAARRFAEDHAWPRIAAEVERLIGEVRRDSSVQA